MKRAVVGFCVVFAFTVISRAQSSYGPVAYWSEQDLRQVPASASSLPGTSGITPFHTDTRSLLTTATHRFSVIKASGNCIENVVPAFSEGATNIFFALAGSADIYTNSGFDLAPRSGGITCVEPSRVTPVAGGRKWQMRQGAIINVPPSTPYAILGSVTLLRLEVNVGMHPWSIVSTQQNTLAETPTHPRTIVPVNATQGDVKFWSAEELQKAHTTMAAAAVKGTPMNDPRDLVEIPATRTHAFNFLHRVMGANGQPPGVEYHGGNTDIYFIIAGTGTVMTDGTIENREPIPNRPLEERGTLIRNGVGYKVKAGDVINMPPNTPHQSIPDAGGFTYMLIKVNTGRYPWELIR
jgi:mannose-6-phosphate isomerase-like protein (cupin superfamily)